jgi:hypothetical protein
MASAFSITITTNSVSIGKQRNAAVLFTVTNTSGKPLTGRSVLFMDPPNESQAAWLRLKPPQESERSFPVNGVENYTVEVNVPVEASVGDYIFHLDMLGTEDPDETYTAGPRVKLLVAQPEKKEKKPFPWWIIAVAVGVLAVIIGVIIFWPRRIAVPNVINQPEIEARAIVTAAGLTFEKIAEKSSEEPVGIVLATTPQAGERIGKATPVFYVLSVPPIDLPGTPVRDTVFGSAGDTLEIIYGGQCSSGFVHSSFQVNWRARQGDAQVTPIGWVDPNDEQLCAIQVFFTFLRGFPFDTRVEVDVTIIIKQVGE